MKETKEETYKDINEDSFLYKKWISENPKSRRSRLTTIIQFQSNPLFVESGKNREASKETSTSFKVHNIKEASMYYKSPSLNMASDLPWRLKANEFRPSPPIRKEMRSYFEKLKKTLGYKLHCSYI